MTEVALEDDQANEDPEYPLRDEWISEQAQKLFRICDSKGQGFIVKSDLSKIDGFINEMTLSQLEEFFESIDVSKLNIVTESQFIDNIKPLLSQMHKVTSSSSTTADTGCSAAAAAEVASSSDQNLQDTDEDLSNFVGYNSDINE
uniref:EF-hand domain-containing protein n=1 Tax=Syphacia muris TaxID=451379 RepID=A0A0N5AKQ5_9BILA